MTVATYDPKQVAITIGTHVVSGFGEDTFVAVEANEDLWSLTVGAGGDAARSKSNNLSGKITITLLQTSDSNQVLQGFLTADQVANTGKFPISVKDTSGLSLYASPEAWVMKSPDAPFGKTISEREWVIEVGQLAAFTSGPTA